MTSAGKTFTRTRRHSANATIEPIQHGRRAPADRLKHERIAAIMNLIGNAKLLLEPETRDRLITLGLARRTGPRHRTVILTARARSLIPAVET
jgi:hypothetical protein